LVRQAGQQLGNGLECSGGIHRGSLPQICWAGSVAEMEGIPEILQLTIIK
jgi:hypothetical protein